MHQLLHIRTRCCQMRPKTPHVPILRTSSYSFSASMPKPHLPQGRSREACLRLLPDLPPSTALTPAATTIPSPDNAGLNQSPLLDQRLHHSPLLGPRAPSRVKTPRTWRTMATRHPLLPRPLQPPTMQWTSPPPVSPPAVPRHLPMENRLHPQAGPSNQ